MVAVTEPKHADDAGQSSLDDDQWVVVTKPDSDDATELPIQTSSGRLELEFNLHLGNRRFTLLRSDGIWTRTITPTAGDSDRKQR